MDTEKQKRILREIQTHIGSADLAVGSCRRICTTGKMLENLDIDLRVIKVEVDHCLDLARELKS